MTIGRTDDPENPISVPAFEAAKLFGTGSRTPSGPADMVPRQQAGHMLAFDTPVRILLETLASEGPSTHARRNTLYVQVRTRPDLIGLRVCTLDDPGWFQPDADIFMKSAQPWDHDQPNVPKYDGYPPGKSYPTAPSREG